MQFFYNLLVYILYLPYVGYWFVRGLVNRSYWDKIGERIGIGYPEARASVSGFTPSPSAKSSPRCR